MTLWLSHPSFVPVRVRRAPVHPSRQCPDGSHDDHFGLVPLLLAGSARPEGRHTAVTLTAATTTARLRTLRSNMCMSQVITGSSRSQWEFLGMEAC